MNRNIVLAACFALVGAFSAVAAAADSTSTSKMAASAQASHTQKITIGNFTFQPNTLTVSAGTELTWVNDDDVPHIVIGTDSDSPIKSQPLDTDDHYSVVITKPGTYKYFCSMHPHMTGTIVVQ